MLTLAKKALKGSISSRKKINEKFGHSEYRFLKYMAEYKPNLFFETKQINDYYKIFCYNLDCTIEYFSPEQILARKRYNRMIQFFVEVFTETFVNIKPISEETILLDTEFVEEIYTTFCGIIKEQFEFLSDIEIKILTLRYGFNFTDFVPNNLYNITRLANTLKISRGIAVKEYSNVLKILRTSPKIKSFESFLNFRYNGEYLYKKIKQNPDLKCSELLNQISFVDGLAKKYFNTFINKYEEFLSVPISFLTVSDIFYDLGVTDYKGNNTHITIERFYNNIGSSVNVYKYFSAKEYRIIFSSLFKKGILYISEVYTDFYIKDMIIKSDRFKRLLKQKNINYISEILVDGDFFLNPYNTKNSIVGYLELMSILKDADILCLKQFYNS